MDNCKQCLEKNQYGNEDIKMATSILKLQVLMQLHN